MGGPSKGSEWVRQFGLLFLSQQCEIMIMNSYIIPYILIYFDERVASL